MLWRKRDAIYFLLQVRDNKVMPAPGDKRGLAFKYDCLELFFDSRPYGKRGGTVSEGADQAIIMPSDSVTTKPCKLWLVRSDKVHIAVECVDRRTLHILKFPLTSAVTARTNGLNSDKNMAFL